MSAKSKRKRELLIQEKENIIKLIAPAKVNLFLAVGDKQTDGFHKVVNIMHTLTLHDVLYIHYTPSKNLNIDIELLQSADPDVLPPKVKTEDNLVYKAIKLLNSKLDKPLKYNFKIYIEKNIPYQAGLGGGSSDACAALIGVASIAGIKRDDIILLSTAKELGSDVPFFLDGSCAEYTNKGELLNHKLKPINREIVLVRPMPSKGLSTAEVYSTFDKLKIAPDEDRFTQVEKSAENLIIADNVPLFNNLAGASEALLPELSKIRGFLEEKTGKDNVLLCGSGNATFAYVPTNANTDSLLDTLKKQGWWATLSSLANVKARQIPYKVDSF